MAYNATTWQTGDIITAANLNKIEKELVGIEDIIADSYSASKKYAVGDYVIQEKTVNGSKVNKLYKCITAITSGEAWNAAHWEETKLKNEVGGKDAIASTFSTSTAYKAGEYVWYDGTLYQFTADHAAGAWIGTDAITAVVGKDIAVINDTIEQLFGSYNYYDPKAIYTQTNKEGAARNGYTINADGSITGTKSLQQSGQFFLVDTKKILTPGKYIISGKMTLTSEAPDDIMVYSAIGRTVTYRATPMTTTREGGTNIQTGEKVGWFKAEYELMAEEPFAFECIPGKSSMVDASHPCKIEYLMIVKGDVLPEYTSNTMTSEDKIARKEIAELNESISTLTPAVNSIISGTNITHTVSATGSQNINCQIVNGGKYVFTNNTSGACSLNLLRADETTKSVIGQVNAGASYTFVADEDDFVGIRSYANGTGTMTLTGDVSLGALTVASRIHDIALKNLNGIVYETASATLSYETYGSNGGISFTITGNNKFSVRLETPNGRISKDVSFSDAASDALDYITVDDNSAVIVLDRYSKTLVYNTTDGQLHIRDLMVNGWQHADDILLIANAYGRPVEGVLFREYMNRKNESDYLKATDIFNAEPYTGDYAWQTPLASYGKLFNGKNHVESFAFFTDPHVLGFGDDDRNETKMHNYLKRVQTVYNQSPCSYIVSCGDWLNNTTTMDEACYRLGQLKGIAEHMFDGMKIVLGNHDTNYQGKATPESENWTGRLTDETIAAIMYRDSETKKAYFSFEGDYATCYVLDSGTETGHSAMLTYDWEQLAWLAGKLSQDDPEHAIIFLHIIVSEDTVQTFAATFGQLVEAYNAHTTITLNSQTYDFTGCSGRVDLWVAGHTHVDSNGLLGGVPYVISTTNAYTSDVPIIDLALMDYDNNILYLKRVGGKGADRTISLTTGQLITG